MSTGGIGTDVKLFTPEELALLVRFVGANPLPDTRDDPLVGVGLQQASLTVLHAERSLRARGFAHLDEKDNLVVTPDVLSSIVTCGFAEQALWMSHWSPDGRVAEGYGYSRSDTFVLHTRAKPPLHRFLTSTDAELFLASCLDTAGCAKLTAEDFDAFQCASDLLSDLLQAPESVNVAEQFTEEEQASVARFVGLTADDHSVSTFRHLVPGPNGEFDSHEVTVVHGGGYGWVLEAADSETYKVRSVGSADVYAMLAGLLDVGAVAGDEQGVELAGSFAPGDGASFDGRFAH